MPLTDAEEAAVLVKRTPGGVEFLPRKRPRLRAWPSRDEQLDRAEDLLKGLILYDRLTSAPKPQKMAAK